jgi:hypothetical protein
LALVGLIAALLCAPFFRFLYYLGDEGTLLHEAELVLRGQRLYADFFGFLPPGAIVVTAAWFSVAGVSFGAAVAGNHDLRRDRLFHLSELSAGIEMRRFPCCWSSAG